MNLITLAFSALLGLTQNVDCQNISLDLEKIVEQPKLIREDGIVYYELHHTKEEVDAFWTRERIESATPLDIVIVRKPKKEELVVAEEDTVYEDIAVVHELKETPEEVRAYWTQERMDNAEPMELPTRRR